MPRAPRKPWYHRSPPPSAFNKQLLVWAPGTQSMRQRTRYLSARCRNLLDSTDPFINAAGMRVAQSVANEPTPEYAMLHLFAAGLDAEAETGQPWHVCMNHIMDKFDGKLAIVEEDEHAEAPESPSKSGGRLRRLLRKAFPFAFRQNDETSAKESVDQ